MATTGLLLSLGVGVLLALVSGFVIPAVLSKVGEGNGLAAPPWAVESCEN